MSKTTKKKISVTVIRYRMEGIATCATPCPFTDPKKRGLGTRVGSAACEECIYHIANDRKSQVLCCSNPGHAVFCKKDKLLNEETHTLTEWAAILVNNPELGKLFDKVCPPKPIE